MLPSPTHDIPLSCQTAPWVIMDETGRDPHQMGHTSASYDSLGEEEGAGLVILEVVHAETSVGLWQLMQYNGQRI